MTGVIVNRLRRLESACAEEQRRRDRTAVAAMARVLGASEDAIAVGLDDAIRTADEIYERIVVRHRGALPDRDILARVAAETGMTPKALVRGARQVASLRSGERGCAGTLAVPSTHRPHGS